MMYRQLLNMIVHDSRTNLYSLCRIDPFHPSPQAVSQAAARAAKANNGDGSSSWLSAVSSFRSLPRPEINFSSPPKSASVPQKHFFSLVEGNGVDCVLYASPSRYSLLYDYSKTSIVNVPQPNFCKPRDAFSFNITRRQGSVPQDSYGLYVLGNSGPETCFEVFNYGKRGPGERDLSWYWERLPSPPPALSPQPLWSHVASSGGGVDAKDVWHPSAVALVDDDTLCVSSDSMDDGRGGTYTFDMANRKWRHAGDWVLPIRGTAKFAPELGFWFGLTSDSDGHRLCAFELSPSSSSSPPTVQHTWEYLHHPPEDECWEPRHPHQLVYLGSGRFCIATSFLKVDRRTLVPLGTEAEDQTMFHELTVLTGVEVVHSNSCDSNAGHGLQMINHMSLHYNDIDGIRVHCVM